MTIKRNKKRGNHKEMSIDQQIRQCEEKISNLEDWKREIAMSERDQNQIKDKSGNVEQDLDREYEQIALLKIRKMMGY